MIIIVGAGAHGLSLAYHLKKKGINDVTIIEMKRIGYGSSSRNAARFRYHFKSRENINFALKAIPYLLEQAKELPLNSFVYKSGYLWVLKDEKNYKVLSSLDSLWKGFGIGGKFVNCRDFYFLNIDSDCYLAPQDGAFHHDYLLYSYYIETKGYKFIFDTVEKVVVESGKVKGVKLSTGSIISGDTVVITAGAWSNEILKRSNVLEVPIYPEKKEIFITEPIKFMIKPLVIDESDEVYFSQTLKGEIIGGMSYERERGFLPFSNSFNEIVRFSKAIKSLVKDIEGIGILRGWSGYYEMTPDSSHIMGYYNEWPEGLYIDAGYSGHGMMFAPYSGKLMADLIVDGIISEEVKVFSPERFRENRLINENLVI
jgi:sarcosine oxidase subunit beta